MRGEHLSSQFTYDPIDKTFSAWVCELGYYAFKPINGGTMPDGLVMVSCKTGEKATFMITETIKDDDNDITHWLLRPSSETVERNPGLKDHRMIVFND